jgi:hypothetical protein
MVSEKREIGVMHQIFLLSANNKLHCIRPLLFSRRREKIKGEEN